MDYLYDVFISYRRHPEWTPWTRDHFHTLLEAYLTQELPETPRIFIDERITPGADWPLKLGESLGRARVLLTIFSGDYFSSQWCLHELDLMNNRRCCFPGCDIIIPVIGHDGDLIPNEIGRIQQFNISKYRNTDIQRRTPRFEEFSEEVKKMAPHVAAAIESAPQFDENWIQECQSRFEQVYEAYCRGDKTPVTSITLKNRPPLSTPPRVIPRSAI